MTKAELKKTIEWLREFVWRLEDRDDGEKLKEQTDRLKAEIKKLEERHDAL